MEIVVGQNSYMTLAEAKELVNYRLSKKDPVRVYWEGLDDEEKTSIILSSTFNYDTDAMLYKGYKIFKNQPLQFPRRLANEVIDADDRIKLGLIVQGIKSEMYSYSEESEIVSKGIKSFADGTGARIEFSEDAIKGNNTVCNGIFRDVFNTYFKQYTIIV